MKIYRLLLLMLLSWQLAFTQTHTFCASDSSCNYTGSNTFGSDNSVLFPATCGLSSAPSWCSGSDLGAWINAAIAHLPTAFGYATGVIRLDGLTSATQTTKVTLNSPNVDIIGPGAGALQITCTIPECWRITTNPFTVNQAGKIAGFTLVGNGSANQVGIHFGDITGLEFDDVVVDSFTGTGARGMWADNVLGWTERVGFSRVQIGAGNGGNTVDLYFSYEAGSGGSNSFGYWSVTDLRMNVGANQIGMEDASGWVYSWKNFALNANLNSSSGILIKLDGVNSVWFDNNYAVVAECTACSGNATMLNVNSASSLTGIGYIAASGAAGSNLTNTIGAGATVMLYVSSIGGTTGGGTGIAGWPVTSTNNTSIGAVGARSLNAGPWMLTNPGAPGSNKFGFCNNVYWTTAGTWLTYGDGSTNGGQCWLGGSNGNLELYMFPSTGGTAQSIANASLGTFRKAFFDNNGGLTLASGISASGYTNVTQLIFPGTPTISSGFGTSPSVLTSNGSNTLRVNVGTGGTATSGVIGMPFSATTGWNCTFSDMTTHSNFPQQTASTANTVTVGGFNSAGTATAWVASDTLIANCFAY